MSKKKLLAVNLNEFNLEFLKHGSKKYNCKNIKKFLSLKHIKTFSADKEQDKSLDPWVQNISINSGMKTTKHKIYNLGEKIPNNLNQIWDFLSRKNYRCGVWGPMNTNFKNNKNLKIFLPDPWNYQNKVKPFELNSLYSLSRKYAKDYTDFSILENLQYFINFFIYLLKTNITYEVLKYFPLFLKIFLKNGLRNYFLFFLFDIISLIIFKKISKNQNLNFSLIFLNSLAHFQHNNWNEVRNHKYYFYLTDIIFKIIFEINKNYNSLIIYNAFSQKKIDPEYLIRPKNPINFFKLQKIRFSNFHSNMTNGFIITFKNKANFKKGLRNIKNIKILGYKLFKIKILRNNQLFCRVQVKSKNNLSNYINTSKISSKNFFYEKKIKLHNNNSTININEFIRLVSFIKTTSKHISDGEIFYENFDLTNKIRIENIKIFGLIKNYFKI